LIGPIFISILCIDPWQAIARTGRGYDSKSKDIEQAYRILRWQINPPGWMGVFAVQPAPE
jgi:hypothetical protein